MKTRKRRLAILLGILAAAYLGGWVWVLVKQDEMLIDPTPIPEGAPATAMDRAFKEEFIPVGSGPDQGWLHARWLAAADASAPTFLYLHGQTHNNSTHPEHAQRLYQLGYHVLMVDYRGFGKSRGGGKPSESKLYEDAEAAWNYLTRKRQPQHLFIFGHSLGAAIAVDLAARHPEAAGLVTESAFTSVPDMARRNYRYLPTGWLVSLRFDSLQKVGTLKIPVLLIHGKMDKTIPCEMSERLYTAAPEPKKLLIIEGAGHANCIAIGWTEYDAAVTTFVQTHHNRTR